VQQVHLNVQEDSIFWKLKLDGTYNTKSAYEIQFARSFPDFEWNKVWEARVEPKCKIFTWLLIQNQLWTTDRVIKHGGLGKPNLPVV
jgi:hypothetical protein